MKAADEFKDKMTPPNQVWQADLTYLEGDWLGLVLLSTVRADFSRYIVAWKLYTTMKAEDVTSASICCMSCLSSHATSSAETVGI